jgi:hypothetical protein
MSVRIAILSESRRAIGPLIGLALGALLVTTAAAQGGRIQEKEAAGCVNSRTGTLRIIELDKTCVPGEAPITLSLSPKAPVGEASTIAASDGTLVSPNGLFKVSVTDDGIELRGPDATILVGTHSIDVHASNKVDIAAFADLDLRSNGSTEVRGASVSVNPGNCRAAARTGDAVGGGQITGGAPTVCIGD